VKDQNEFQLLASHFKVSGPVFLSDGST